MAALPGAAQTFTKTTAGNAMATNPSIRTMFTMSEAATHLGWSDQDLREAIILGRITPSYYVNKAVWVYDVDTSGALKKRTPATFKNDWMYAVRFKQTAAWDGHFEYLAETPQAPGPNSVLYQLTGESMVGGHILPLAEVLAKGVVMKSEIDRFAPSTTAASQIPGNATSQSKKPQWWNTAYNILAMADAEKSKRAASGFGVNQSGKRAGKHPLSTMASALAHQVEKQEKDAGRKRSIGAKTIENFLRENGWH